jgi:hypothetical protein
LIKRSNDHKEEEVMVEVVVEEVAVEEVVVDQKAHQQHHPSHRMLWYQYPQQQTYGPWEINRRTSMEIEPKPIHLSRMSKHTFDLTKMLPDTTFQRTR